LHFATSAPLGWVEGLDEVVWGCFGRKGGGWIDIFGDVGDGGLTRSVSPVGEE